jgi:hypothetical protein
MGEGVAVRPDQVSLGVVVTAVPRDAVDGAVAACGVGDRRSGGKLPAHVTAYLTMALIAVGTAVAGGPPRRSQRAELPHWAPALGSGVEPRVGERMPQAGGW